MSHKFTIESATQIQRGTGIENEIYAMVKFKELSAPVPFYAYRIAEEEQRRELWERFNSGEFGEVTWPPSAYRTHPKTQLELEESNRATRDELLLKSDWTQTADAPISTELKAQWAAYRQQLREVPSQPGFPYEITWPVQPN
jgi:hypothetical protein